MWQEDQEGFANQYGIPLRLARFYECTGEHLIAHKDGGSVSQANIVAACWLCNQRRHKRKHELDPDNFISLVQRRIKGGRWHPVRLS
jgi:HNH endonuclease